MMFCLTTTLQNIQKQLIPFTSTSISNHLHAREIVLHGGCFLILARIYANNDMCARHCKRSIKNEAMLEKKNLVIIPGWF